MSSLHQISLITALLATFLSAQQLVAAAAPVLLQPAEGAPAPSWTVYPGFYVRLANDSSKCMQPNPRAHFKCACPPGSKESHPMSFYHIGFRVPSFDAHLIACNPPEPTKGFGGMFQENSAGECVVPNPYTQDCTTCPGGGKKHKKHHHRHDNVVQYKMLRIPTAATNKNVLEQKNTTIGFCVYDPPGMFANGDYQGSFVVSFPPQAPHPPSQSWCMQGNPFIQGECKCPQGTNPDYSLSFAFGGTTSSAAWLATCYQQCMAEKPKKCSGMGGSVCCGSNSTCCGGETGIGIPSCCDATLGAVCCPSATGAQCCPAGRQCCQFKISGVNIGACCAAGVPCSVDSCLP